MRVVVRRVSQLSSARRYALWGLGLGFVSPLTIFGGMALVIGTDRGMGHIGSFRSFGYLLAATGIWAIVFLWVPVARWSRIRGLREALAWGASMGLGGTGALAVIVQVWDRPHRVLTFDRFAAWFGWMTLSMAATGALCVAVWGLVRLWTHACGDRVVDQDGATCPMCAYDLTGNRPMICPECGRPFTLDELETTRERFESRSRVDDSASRRSGEAKSKRTSEPLCFARSLLTVCCWWVGAREAVERATVKSERLRVQ